MQRYEVVVVGLGAVGSAALEQLARRGCRVLGLDRFRPAHERGSSHGRTRIIRQAYFEHPAYVPLVLRAYELWQDLERHSGRSLLVRTGLLQVGPRDGAVIDGVLASARAHDLPVETLSAAEVAQRWPGFRLPVDSVGVYEAAAGILRVEDCVQAQLDQAVALGAEILCGAAVTSWEVRGGQVEVACDGERFLATRLVLAGGAWAAELLGSLRLPLVVLRKPQFWFRAEAEEYRADRGCPAYLFELPAGVFYGFPTLGGGGLEEGVLKVAEHSGGEPVADPLAVDRNQREADRERVANFLREHLPRVSAHVVDHRVCLYTMTPDRHFVLDQMPGLPQVVYAAGLSGHGFKFAPVLGAALADLALTGESPLPIEFLRAERLARLA